MKKLEGNKIEFSMEEIVDELHPLLNAIDVRKKDRLTYCTALLDEKFRNKEKKYNKEVDKINHRHCSIDKDENIIIKDGEYVFKRDKIEARLKEIYDEKQKTVEITTEKCPVLKRFKDLNVRVLFKFDGILFDLPENFWDEKEEETPLNGKEEKKTEKLAN